MTRRVHVMRSQVEAARLRIARDKAEGRETPAAVLRIADARPDQSVRTSDTGGSGRSSSTAGKKYDAKEPLLGLVGAEAYDSLDEKIGQVTQVFLGDGGEPEWVAVDMVPAGTGEKFVPLHDAWIAGRRLYIAFRKSQVEDAPEMSSEEGPISEGQERDLLGHYGLPDPGVERRMV
ncbi:MAG: hypothetical protein M3P83_11315 [Actinomycetota bacterium]|nr:hypothetical protein [Actinomycetota bacterium]